MNGKEYTDWKGFGDRLKYSRKSIGMTVEKLADKVDRTENFINRIENGRKSCSIQTLFQFCNALNVSADFLLFGDEVKSDNFSDLQIVQNVFDKCNADQLSVLKDIVLAVYHKFDELAK